MVRRGQIDQVANLSIKALLQKLNETGASDLLLVVDDPPTLKINNSLQKLTEKKLTADEVESLIAGIVDKAGLEKFKAGKELGTAYEDGISRYRVNLHYQKGSAAAAIRRIPKIIPPFESLGLPPIVKYFTELERGLVLVTGPTGCGKSTTQAAMIDLINASRPCHIITVEDPIEFIHTQKKAVVEQREVGFDTLTFAEALKNILRQVPDVILVGEMRDLESMQMAITAAETGHLVISTLHTQDAVQSIDRIVDVFPPHQQGQIRTQLSLTLQGIVAQQLLPDKDGRKLVGAFEVLMVTPAIRNIIRKGTTQDIYSMMEIGKQQGMIGMDQSIAKLFKEGVITRQEALAAAISRERLEKNLA